MPGIITNPAYGAGVVNPSGAQAGEALNSIASVFQNTLPRDLQRQALTQEYSKFSSLQGLQKNAADQAAGRAVDPAAIAQNLIGANIDAGNYTGAIAAGRIGPNGIRDSSVTGNAVIHGQYNASPAGVDNAQQFDLTKQRAQASLTPYSAVGPDGVPIVSDNATAATGGLPQGSQPLLNDGQSKALAARNVGLTALGAGASTPANPSPFLPFFAGVGQSTPLSPADRQQAGISPSTPDSFQKAPNGAITPIASTGADPYTAGLTTGLGKAHAALSDGVEEAQTRSRDLNAMQGAVQRIQAAGGTTGLGAPEMLKVQSLVNSGLGALGLPQMDVSDKEFLTKFNRQIAAAAASSGANGGRVTNFALQNMLKANPGLELSPTGNQRLIGIQQQIEQRNVNVGQQIRQMTADAVHEGRHVDPSAVEKLIRGYDDQHHVTDPVTGQDLTQNPTLADLQSGGGAPGPVNPGAGVPPAATPAQGGPAPAPINSQQQYDALPHGGMYIDARDGKTKRKT